MKQRRSRRVKPAEKNLASRTARLTPERRFLDSDIPPQGAKTQSSEENAHSSRYLNSARRAGKK
jgi:hypothetical protein